MAPKKEPPPAPPHRAVQAVGKKWIFSSSSRSFGYGFEAVRIRVNVSKYTVHTFSPVGKITTITTIRTEMLARDP
jgi:hypothetical protein